MVNEQDIQKALDALNAQLIPNYSQVSRDYGIERTTLMRRHKGICSSRQQATSLHHKLLTDTQEEALISQINKLTVRGLPPTSHIVKNLAEEIIGHEVNKNWTSSFVQRYSSRLKSLYLRNIDNLRMKSEYRPYIQFFFDLVAFDFSIVYVLPLYLKIIANIAPFSPS
jgi:transposase-like protein